MLICRKLGEKGQENSIKLRDLVFFDAQAKAFEAWDHKNTAKKMPEVLETLDYTV